MTIRKTIVALVTAMTIAFPVSAKADGTEEEELVALGVAAGAAAVLVLGGLVTVARNRAPAQIEPLAYSGVTPADSSAHSAYCADRYRSYDAATNTFQPYSGPRRACVSPFAN